MREHVPLWTFNVESLREIENVPLETRCLRSILPAKKKSIRKSFVPFGRSES